VHNSGSHENEHREARGFEESASSGGERNSPLFGEPNQVSWASDFGWVLQGVAGAAWCYSPGEPGNLVVRNLAN
jgi:hypothetical protein